MVRPLGAYERFFYLLTQREPRHFVVALTFGTVLIEEQVRSALAAVMDRHVVLGTHVEDNPPTGLGFCRPADTPAVALAVHPQEDAWRSLAGEELSRVFDASTGALLRAALCTGTGISTLLLVFNHTGADGISATFVVRDLVAALNGHPLEALPMPPPPEELIARTAWREAPADRPADTRDPAPDARMANAVSLRSFDGTPPRIGTAVLDRAGTRKLIERCRAEGTTVHTAIVTAASHEHAAVTGEDFVRATSPFSIRALVHAGEGSGLYFFTLRTGMDTRDARDFWDQAREVKADIEAARSPATVTALSNIFQRAIPVDADDVSVDALVGDSLNYEMMISNLGVLDLPDFGPVRPVDVWGPLMRNQSELGTLGTVTLDSRLHLSLCGYGATQHFVAGLAQRLLAAA